MNQLFPQLRSRGITALVLAVTVTLVATGPLAAPASLAASAAPAPAESADTGATVWAVDLVRTLPGAQADYLASIETNWANARRIARVQGAVRSYRALVTASDSARSWDVILMTEYADSAAWARREEIFQAIFAAPEFTAVPPARPSAEMRAFIAGDIQMRAIVSVP